MLIHVNTVGDLIAELQKFDPSTRVMAYWEDTLAESAECYNFYFDANPSVTAVKRSENGGLTYLARNDPAGVDVLFLTLQRDEGL